MTATSLSRGCVVEASSVAGLGHHLMVFMNTRRKYIPCTNLLRTVPHDREKLWGPNKRHLPHSCHALAFTLQRLRFKFPEAWR